MDPEVFTLLNLDALRVSIAFSGRFIKCSKVNTNAGKMMCKHQLRDEIGSGPFVIIIFMKHFSDIAVLITNE